MVAGTLGSPSFIIDSGASRHMVLTKEAFSSLDMSKGPPIGLGDDSLTDSLGKGRIDIDHGKFNNVLYVPESCLQPLVSISDDSDRVSKEGHLLP